MSRLLSSKTAQILAERFAQRTQGGASLCPGLSHFAPLGRGHHNPIAVLAAARYCGAATTYSLLSPKISKASSRIGLSSGKIGQLRMPRPS